MDRGDWQRLLHIKTYCQDIASFIDRFGNSFNSFSGDRAYFSAVSMCILQIGELSNGLSESFRFETKDEIPWGMIRGMRNWMAHADNEMDESVIWETAQNDIPKLYAFCEQKLQTERVPMKDRFAMAKETAAQRNAERAGSVPGPVAPKKDDPSLE